MSSIEKLYTEAKTYLGENPEVKQKLENEISSSLLNIFRDSLNSDESYCYRFKLPLRLVNSIPSRVGLTQNQIYKAFESDWKRGAMSNNMHSDPYYQNLLFLFYFYTKEDNKTLKESILTFILMKLWNGRKSTFFQYCDPKIMKYVVQYMTSKRHKVSNYNGPLELIKDYFVPALISKYGDKVKYNPSALQAIFEGAYTRLRQIFVFGNRKDVETGENVAQGGLLPLYKKAKENGWSIDTVKTYGDEDHDPSHYDYMTNNSIDELIDNTANHITMSSNFNYADKFIENLRIETKIKPEVIEKILNSLHNHNYFDEIHDILSIIISMTGATSEQDICGRDFLSKVRSKIIKSKNNSSKTKLDRDTEQLLKYISDDIGQDLTKYSSVNKSQIKNRVIVLGLVYNLRYVACK